MFHDAQQRDASAAIAEWRAAGRTEGEAAKGRVLEKGKFFASVCPVGHSLCSMMYSLFYRMYRYGCVL